MNKIKPKIVAFEKIATKAISDEELKAEKVRIELRLLEITKSLKGDK